MQRSAMFATIISFVLIGTSWAAFGVMDAKYLAGYEADTFEKRTHLWLWLAGALSATVSVVPMLMISCNGGLARTILDTCSGAGYDGKW